MKAISMKATGQPQNALSRAIRIIVANRIHIAAVSALVTLAGAVCDIEPMMYAGAVAALICVNPGKGGER